MIARIVRNAAARRTKRVYTRFLQQNGHSPFLYVIHPRDSAVCASEERRLKCTAIRDFGRAYPKERIAGFRCTRRDTFPSPLMSHVRKNTEYLPFHLIIQFKSSPVEFITSDFRENGRPREFLRTDRRKFGVAPPSPLFSILHILFAHTVFVRRRPPFLSRAHALRSLRLLFSRIARSVSTSPRALRPLSRLSRAPEQIGISAAGETGPV